MAKVLIVDDTPLSIRSVWRYLRDMGYEVEVATSGSQGLEMAHMKSPDVILLDMIMPDLDGITVLSELLTDSDPSLARTPIIMVSASDREEDIVQALDMGAQDYVTKPVSLSVLTARLRSALRVKYSQEALERANEHLMALSSIDPLTQTFNRRRFFELSVRELAKAQRFGRSLSMLMVDADHFKTLNDRFGHAFGDKALRMVASVLRANCRETDIIARMGGEEFAVCCPETDLEGGMLLAERIREGVSNHEFKLGERLVHVTISVGVASLCEIDRDIDALMERADRLMYQAKERGRNKVVGA